MNARHRLVLLASLLALGCLEGDPNPYAEQPASGGGPTALSPGSACAVTSSTAVSLTLNNRSTHQLRVLWIDYSCQEQLMGSIAPGQSFGTSTFATHPWRLRDSATNALLFEYVTTAAPQQNIDVNVR